MPLTLRAATRADIPMLRLWDEQPHVIESDPNDDWDWENQIDAGLAGFTHLIAEEDGRAVGFVQLLDPHVDPTRYWGETGAGYRAIDIWIGLPADLGRGLGTRMMDQAMALCFSAPEVHTVLIDPLVSNTDAIRFYRRLGFRHVEDRTFGADRCAVHAITRQQWLQGTHP